MNQKTININDLISWYPWKKHASVLQIETTSSVYDINTLKECNENCSNLDIIFCSIDKLTFTQKFDYILVSEAFEQAGKGSKEESIYVSFLQKLLNSLKSDGKLLIIATNQYGISNWAGTKERYSKIPFESLAGYPDEVEGRGFHKRELQNILTKAGVDKQRFFYPIINNQKVAFFSDDRLPTINEIDQIYQTLEIDDSCVFNEKNVMKDILENGSFPFFTNLFLIEAGRTAEFPFISYKNLDKFISSDIKLQKTEDSSLMKENRYLLASKGKSKIIKIDKDYELIRKVVSIQLDLLKKLLDICEKHNLQVFMIYGTLLGAVRHNGVIPGDDDIDVALPRKDYNQLLQLVNEFKDNYFLQTPWNDNCFFGGYSKLRNRSTTSINPQNWWVDCCEGIGIDIFPIDDSFENRVKEWWKEKRICFYQRLIFAKIYGYSRRFLDMPLLIWKGYRYLGKPFSKEKLLNRFNRIVEKGDTSNNAKVGIYTHYLAGRKVQLYKRDLFLSKIQMQYENMILDAPIGFEKLLKKRYGIEYMSYPNYQEGKYRHGFYNVDVPYNNYKKRFAGLFRPKPDGKDIILVGEKEIFQEFFHFFGRKYLPKYLITTKANQIDESVEEINLKGIDFLQRLVDKNVYLVISSAFIRETEQVIRDVGFRDYYIFVKDRGWILLENPEYILKQIERI